MFRNCIPVLVVSVTLSFVFSACGLADGRDDDECADCGAFGGAAVRCYTSPLTWQYKCGPDLDLAAGQCIEAGGEWEVAEVCAEADTEGDPPSDDGSNGQSPWSPSRDIVFDNETNTFVINQIAFEDLKVDPSPLFSDTSGLRETESGYYQLDATGKLSQALGWHKGDIVLEVNGYSLAGLAEFSDAYPSLSQLSEFELVVQRGADEVVLNYRIE